MNNETVIEWITSMPIAQMTEELILITRACLHKASMTPQNINTENAANPTFN